jgi:tryptophan halogenase
MAPKKVLILGGGCAGWMAAVYLQTALGDNGQRRVDIGVLESPDAPQIAKGEATLPDIRHMLDVIGFSEIDFLKRVDGTFKQAIKHVNWVHGHGDYYFHTLDRSRMQPIDTLGMLWLMSDHSIPFAETISTQPMICELGLAPLPLGSQGAVRLLSYAYHVNVQKFADLLREIAVSKGVSHHIDDVVDVEMADNGDIAAIQARNGKRLDADLFVDCTGKDALLIGKQLGVDWVDFSNWLLCDRTVTMDVPYDDYYPGYIRPYTTATALSSGWSWDIPLQTHRSLGYVNSGAFIDEEGAADELRVFEGSHAESLETRTHHFKVGYRAKPWARNCVSIGHATGYIEPLESTDLYLASLATEMLAEHFPYVEDMTPLAYRYNRILANRFYEILDFVNMHYCLTQRADSEFWHEVRKPEHINERLQAKLDFWKVKIPSMSDFVDQKFPAQPETALPDGNLPGDHRAPVDTAALFGIDNYEAVLYGMGFLAEECDRWFGEKRPKTRIPKQIVENLRRAPDALPPHAAWLQQIVGMPEYPASSGARP